MTGPQIRAAVEDDLPSLLRIYNHYVTTSHVTFDTYPLTIDDRLGWFEGFAPAGPHRLLVAVVDSEAIGYASSRPFRAKPAYHTSVETSIYLDPAFTGKHIGNRLFAELLKALEQEGSVHRAFAGIAIPNAVSEALHIGLQFQKIGTFHEVGYKFGQYWDVSWYERDLSGNARPAPRKAVNDA